MKLQRHVHKSWTYLSKAGCIDWLQLLSLAEVKVVFVDGAARQTDTLLIVVVTLKPASVCQLW